MPRFFHRNKSTIKTLNQQLNSSFFNRENWQSSADKTSASWQYKFKNSSETEAKVLDFLEAKGIPFQVSISRSDKKTLIRAATNIESMQAMLALINGKSKFNDKLNERFYDKANWIPIDGNEYLQFSIKAYDVAEQKILNHFLEIKEPAFRVQMRSKKDYDVMTIKAKRSDIAKLLTITPSALKMAEKDYHPYDIVKLDNIIEKALLNNDYHKASHHAGEVNIFYPMSQEERLLKDKLDSRIKDFFEEKNIRFIGYGANNTLSIVIKENELAKFQDRPSLVRAA